MAARKRKLTTARKRKVTRRKLPRTAESSCAVRKTRKRRVGVAKRKTTRRTRRKSLLDKILDF